MFSFLISLPCIVALFFAVSFFIKARKGEGRFLFLAIFNLLFLVILAAMYLVSNTEIPETISPIVNLFSLLFYVAILGVPATFYLYTISLSDLESNESLQGKLLKHYSIPLLLLIINIFSYIYLSSSKEEDDFVFQVSENVMNYSNFIALLFVFPILNCFYIYKTIKKFRAHKKRVGQVFSFQEGVDLKWMSYYIVGYCLFIVSVYLLQGYNNLQAVFIPTSVFLLVYLLFVGVSGKLQKKVLFKKPIHQEETLELSIDDNGEERLEALKERINEVMKKEPYLNKSLTLHEFSKIVGSNSKYISTLLNNEFQQNFSTFINTYRVDKAKKMLDSEISTKFTIEAISERVGFRSKSAFNGAFKNISGLTPSQYRKKQLTQHS